MRNLLIPALGCLLFVSCKMPKIPNTHSATDPYVQTKEGKRVEAKNVERTRGLFRKDQIMADGKAFKPKEVAFYATKDDVFANVKLNTTMFNNKKNFAKQVAAGKVNLYRIMVTTYEQHQVGGGAGFGGPQGSYSSHHTSPHYYIQHADGEPVKPLSYKNLLAIETPKTPEYKILEQYHKKRTFTRALGYGGLGLMVGGAVVAGKSADENVGIAGVAAFLVGFFAEFVDFPMAAHNSIRLLKSVLKADEGFDPKRARKNKEPEWHHLAF